MGGWTCPLKGCSVIAALCIFWTSVQIDGAPPPKPALSPCPSSQETLSGQKGHVEWTERQDPPCDEISEWTLPVPPLQGVVLHVQDLYLRNVTKFKLFSYRLNNGHAERKEIPFVYTGGEHYLPLVYAEGKRYPFPVVMVRTGVMITLETPQAKAHPLSRFHMAYEVYPVSDLPSIMHLDKDRNLGGSFIMYNCSRRLPAPEAIACDGIKHCIRDEDEEHCDYRRQGCGDWFPYRDRCLRQHVLIGVVGKIGSTPMTSPIKADKECRNRYGATLATTPDEEAVHLVANLIHMSGVVSAAIGLHKVKPVSKKHAMLYRFQWQWGLKGGPIAYEQTYVQNHGVMLDCAFLEISPKVSFRPLSCQTPVGNPQSFVCMKPNPRMAQVMPNDTQGIHLQEAKRGVHQLLTKECEDGSLVQIFHQCQGKGPVPSMAWSPNHFPLFYCQYGQPVHYSLLCDGLEDCADGSDETGCPFPQTVSKNQGLYICGNQQVTSKYKRCNGLLDCLDGSDEEYCASCTEVYCIGVGCVPWFNSEYFDRCSHYPGSVGLTNNPSTEDVSAIVLDGYGMSKIRYTSASSSSLEGYFQCSNGLYIPSYLIKNGELDCLDGADENVPPERLTCPGFYRCQYSGNCLHADLVCDRVPHCPYKDDERYCHLQHPANCTCEGFVCSCRCHLPRPVTQFWYLRYLDLSRVTTPSLSELDQLDFLQFLNASFCQLTNLTLSAMPQLRILDLSHNMLQGLSSIVIESLSGLTHLNISGNPLVKQLDAAFAVFLTRSGLTNIQHLVMTDTDVSGIEDSSLSPLVHLVSLDIRKNSLEKYSKNVFGGLHSLTLLQTDDSRLCCSYFHHSLQPDCSAPVDELSSCRDLLRLDFFRVFLWVFTFMTILGNSSVLVYKVVTRKKKKLTSYRVLVSHLCVADFLMGVYMMIIGSADVYFRGSYVASERSWKSSNACFAAGFLAFVSSEMSAFIISLITLDRLLMLCFPFKFSLHLTAASAMKLSSAAWALSLLLAALPLMGQLEFYGESSICLPLPITRHQFSGQTYAFLVFIVLNFLLFLFIGVGQLAIYCALRKTKKAVRTKRQEEDSAIAQRLFLVVFTDFCCWFPVGLMGLLAFSGIPIPGVVSVWVAVFILPINSALNPFLYTLSNAKEKWNIKKMNQKSKRILRNLKVEFPRLAPDVVEELVLMYLGANKGVKMARVAKVLLCEQEQENKAENSGNTLTLVEKTACTSTT